MYEVHVRQRHVPMPFEPAEEVESSLYPRFEGIPLRSQVPERLVEAHTAGLLEAEQDKPYIQYSYKYVVQHYLSRHDGEFKGRSARLLRSIATKATHEWNLKLNKREYSVVDVGDREGALAKTLAMQRRMPYNLHPAVSNTNRNGEAMEEPKVLLYAVVEGSALANLPVWPPFVDEGIPALQRNIGCFILDPPMGLQKTALDNDKDLKKAQLEVSQMVMVKDSCQTGRPPLAGIHTSSHMVQHVLMIKTKGAVLNFSTSGPDPVRYFHPVGDEVCDDVSTNSNGFFMTADNQVANPTQKPLLQLEYLIRTCMQPDTHVVVDLCCGSGSGCVAALRMGYHATGIDRSTKQVEEARRRLKIFTDKEVATNRTADFIEDQYRKNQAQRQEISNLKQQSQPSTAAAAGGLSLVPVDLLQK